MNMKMKKIFSSSAAAVILLSMLTACGQSGQRSENSAGTTTNTPATTAAPSTMAEEQQSQMEKVDVGKDFELTNKKITFLSSWARNPANGKAKDVAIEMFQTRYGGEIEDIIVTQDARFDRLATMIATGSSPDFFSAADMDAFPMGPMNNMFQPIDDYIDFNDPQWQDKKNLNDQFIYNGKHYVSAISPEVEVIMLYNKKTMQEYGFDDPADLLEQGRWDWDSCVDMMKKFCESGENHYGIDGWWVSRGFCNSTGVPFIGMKDGTVSNNISDPLLVSAQNLLADLNKEELAYPLWEHGWVSTPANVGKGEVLFYPVGIWALMDLNSEYGMANYSESREDLGFVPFPKCPSADAYYIPARINGFLLCSGAPNPEGFACMMYCEATAAGSEEASAITKDQYFNEYEWTEEMWQMREKIYDMAKENPVFDFMGGVSQDLNTTLDNASKAAYHGGASWAQTREEIAFSVQAEVDKANSRLE